MLHSRLNLPVGWKRETPKKMRGGGGKESRNPMDPPPRTKDVWSSQKKGQTGGKSNLKVSGGRWRVSRRGGNTAVKSEKGGERNVIGGNVQSGRKDLPKVGGRKKGGDGGECWKTESRGVPAKGGLAGEDKVLHFGTLAEKYRAL